MSSYVRWEDLKNMSGDVAILYTPTGVETVTFWILRKLLRAGENLPLLIPVSEIDTQDRNIEDLMGFKKVLVSFKNSIRGAITIPSPSSPTPLDFCFAVFRNAFPEVPPWEFQERVLDLISSLHSDFVKFAYFNDIGG